MRWNSYQPSKMSAGSRFASQQKALRRQFAYSDDYPLAMMIKELNTQILSRVGTGTLSEQFGRVVVGMLTASGGLAAAWFISAISSPTVIVEAAGSNASAVVLS